MDEITILNNECPICKNDLIGNIKFGFLCIDCMITFYEKDLHHWDFRKRR